MNSKEQHSEPRAVIVYVGTYTGGDSDGIHICRLDMRTGKVRPVSVTGGVDNPSYLAVDLRRNRLFAVNELLEFNGRPGGAVSAFAIDPVSGELSFLSQLSSHGGAPCYLSVDGDGRYLLAANYVGGNIVVIPIGDDGVLGEPTDVVAHSGSGPNPRRQSGPHPHSIVFDPVGDHVFAPDLGLDKVLQYRFERDTGRLVTNQPPWVAAAAGSGPRHLVFHPNGANAYVVNELSSTITVYKYNSNHGTLEASQTLSTLPEGYAGANIAADLHLTPDGRFLFASNRGHDSISCYAVAEQGGTLRYLDCIGTQGQKPRGFAIDPTGAYLLVGNQDSHTIVTFKIDKDGGKISPTGHVAQVPSPVCLKFR